MLQVKTLADYIASMDKNSFYLWALNKDIRSDYKAGFNDVTNLEGLEDLMARVVAKHQLNISNPNSKTTKFIMEKVAEKLDGPAAGSPEEK